MWREKIIEAKKTKNITTKMMSEKVRLPEQTITRILSGKTETPRIDSVLDLGAAVGLSPAELFAETTSVLGDKNLIMVQGELEQATAALAALQSEYSSLSEENTALKIEIVTLKSEIDLLRINNEHKDEIIRLHNRYNAYIDSLAK